VERLRPELERLRVLVVCFYFPPAGGGGVQRVLKTAEVTPSALLYQARQ
jgi:hypothetical protein